MNGTSRWKIAMSLGLAAAICAPVVLAQDEGEAGGRRRQKKERVRKEGRGREKAPSLTLEELPEGVRAVVDQEAPGLAGAQIRKRVWRTRKEGEFVKTDLYDINGTLPDGGLAVRMSVTAEGKVIRKSQEISIEALPEEIATKATAAAKPENFELKKAQKSLMGGREVYMVQAEAGGLIYTIHVDGEGKLISLQAHSPRAKRKRPMKKKGGDKRRVKGPGRKGKKGGEQAEGVF